ncbi:hypothetical protein [Pseudomonas faucium]|uniref:hypothetical protein n=1 Tax=Pseudomonas faucium TaxID=2740518 RepID=UPI001F3BAB0E|nr:hypothetical protein [Pseudomonas faucium]
MNTRITSGLDEAELHTSSADLPLIDVNSTFHSPSSTATFDMKQVEQGLFQWVDEDPVMMQRLQVLALDVAQTCIGHSQPGTLPFLVAVLAQVDLEIAVSFATETPDVFWHLCLMAAHNALVAATARQADEPAAGTEQSSTRVPLPLVWVGSQLVEAAAKGSIPRPLISSGVFHQSEVSPAGVPDLQGLAEEEADRCLMNGKVHPQTFVQGMQKRIDMEIDGQMDADAPDIGVLIFLMAAYNALNALRGRSMLFAADREVAPEPLQGDSDSGPPDGSNGLDTVTLYPPGDEPMLLTADEKLGSELVDRAQALMAGFYGALDKPLRERLDVLYSMPKVTGEGLAEIIVAAKKRVSRALSELAGYEVDVGTLRIHTARVDKPAISGGLWAWLSNGTPLQLASPQLTRDAYDFVQKSWMTRDGEAFAKADGSTVTVDELINIGRALDIGQAIGDACDRWANDGDLAQSIAAEAQAHFEITLLDALRTVAISKTQYVELMGCAGLVAPGHMGVHPLPYGNQRLQVEAFDVPVFGLRTRTDHFIYAAIEGGGRLYVGDRDQGLSATQVFAKALRSNLWETRQQLDGWAWSLLGPAATRAVQAKLPQPLPYQPHKGLPATAFWSGQGVYASKAEYDRQASEVRLTVPYNIRQSVTLHPLQGAVPTLGSAFVNVLARSRRAFMASQVKERFTPNEQSSLAHAKRIGGEYLEFVLDVLLIAVPGKVRFPGRTLLFQAMFIKQLAIDLPRSVLSSKWHEAGEVLVEFFETVLEMGTARKAAKMVRSRLDKLSDALMQGQPSQPPLSTEPEQLLRSMLPPALAQLNDSQLSQIIQRANANGPALTAMREGRIAFDMVLALQASLAMNQSMRAQASSKLGTSTYRQLPERVEWPIVAMLSHHLNTGITLLRPDGAPLRRFEPIRGVSGPNAGPLVKDTMLTRFAAWQYSVGDENRNDVVANSLFHYALGATIGVEADDLPAQAQRLQQDLASRLRLPEIEEAMYWALHHGSRPRASVPAEQGGMLAVRVEGKGEVEDGRLKGDATRWVSSEVERHVPDTAEQLAKARMQHDLALLGGWSGLEAAPKLTRGAESLYLCGLVSLFNGVQGMHQNVAVRVVAANRSAAVWGNEQASQVLVLERLGVEDSHHYRGRLDQHDYLLPAASGVNPLSDLVLRLLDDDARNALGINLSQPQVLTASIMGRLVGGLEPDLGRGELVGVDVTPHSGLVPYQQALDLIDSPAMDGLIRQAGKVWLAWGHGALQVKAEDGAWRVFSAAGGAGPLLLRSFGEWRLLQEPIAALERLSDARITDKGLLEQLDLMRLRDPSARVYHLWSAQRGAEGSYISFRSVSRSYYRVRPAEAGAEELEVARPDGGSTGVWLRRHESGVWEPAETLLGGVPDEERVVYWRPWESPAPRPLPAGFGIQGSIHERRFRAAAGSHKALNPFYPFVAPQAQQESYLRRLRASDATLSERSTRDNISNKVAVFSNQWQMPLDITALPFFRMPGRSPRK